MKVTVIGYWGAYPGAGEATSGYLLEHDGFKLLVDCGSGVLSSLQRYLDVQELDAVILSHYHHDHIADIGPLQYAMLVKKTLGVTDKTLPVYGHTDDMQAFEKLTHHDNTLGIAYDPDKPLSLGPFSIAFLKTSHPVPCYGMRFSANGETFVYTADSSYQESFIEFAHDADLLVSECNFYADQDGAKAGHMNSHDAAAIAEKAGARLLLLSHLPHFGNHEQLLDEAKTKYRGKVQLASSGWSWSS